MIKFTVLASAAFLLSNSTTFAQGHCVEDGGRSPLGMRVLVNNCDRLVSVRYDDDSGCENWSCSTNIGAGRRTSISTAYGRRVKWAVCWDYDHVNMRPNGSYNCR